MKYELTLTTKEDDKFKSLDKIQADGLIYLLVQFNFLILNLQKKEHDEEILELRMENDDIPF